MFAWKWKALDCMIQTLGAYFLRFKRGFSASGTEVFQSQSANIPIGWSHLVTQNLHGRVLQGYMAKGVCKGKGREFRPSMESVTHPTYPVYWQKPEWIYYIRVVTLIFTRGRISLSVAFKGPNVIVGLCTCNYSSTVKQELSAAAG